LKIESRQMRQFRRNILTSEKIPVDDYDYYDYDGLVSNGLKYKAGNRELFNQRKGVPGVSATSAMGSFSGFHAGGYGEEYCDNGISVALLITALLGLAVMFWVLYTKITMAAGRKRRSDHGSKNYLTFLETFEDLVYAGRGEYKSNGGNFLSFGCLHEIA